LTYYRSSDHEGRRREGLWGLRRRVHVKRLVTPGDLVHPSGASRDSRVASVSDS